METDSGEMSGSSDDDPGGRPGLDKVAVHVLIELPGGCYEFHDHLVKPLELPRLIELHARFLGHVASYEISSTNGHTPPERLIEGRPVPTHKEQYGEGFHPTEDCYIIGE